MNRVDDDQILSWTFYPPVSRITEIQGVCLHVWVKCIENQLRGYAFLEDSVKIENETAVAAIQQNPEIVSKFVRLLINDQSIALKNSLRGSDFLYSIPSPPPAELVFEIAGWNRYFSISPKECCVSSSSKSNNTESKRSHIPSYVVKLSIPNDNSETSSIPDAISKQTPLIVKHYHYHHCILQHLLRYEIILSQNVVKYYLKHPFLRELHELGKIQFIIPDNRPLSIKRFQKRFENEWKYVQESIQLLRYWNGVANEVRILSLSINDYLWLHPKKVRDFHAILRDRSGVSLHYDEVVIKTDGNSPFSRNPSLRTTLTDWVIPPPIFSNRSFLVRHSLTDSSSILDPSRCGAACLVSYSPDISDLSVNREWKDGSIKAMNLISPSIARVLKVTSLYPSLTSITDSPPASPEENIDLTLVEWCDSRTYHSFIRNQTMQQTLQVLSSLSEGGVDSARQAESRAIFLAVLGIPILLLIARYLKQYQKSQHLR